ncbi:MAG: TetR/AcrR family transcriptional regulator [Candidatus Omnitrophica bacterium]|nr:TetR/AcrR family transcriptional regulator [Candidatus Omnitrophota bacterium]
MPAMDRKERDKQLRRTDILKAAERVFATKGYHKTTISDIAEEAQYAVGTLYIYFKDKPTLYLTLIEKKSKDLIATVKEKVNQISDIKEKIRVLVETQLSYFKENEDFFRIYFSEREGVRWTIKDKISRTAVETFLKYIDYIAELVKNAQLKGIIKKKLDSKQVAYILAAMMNAVIMPWLREQSLERKEIKDLSGFILEIFYDGVGKR